MLSTVIKQFNKGYSQYVLMRYINLKKLPFKLNILHKKLDVFFVKNNFVFSIFTCNFVILNIFTFYYMSEYLQKCPIHNIYLYMYVVSCYWYNLFQNSQNSTMANGSDRKMEMAEMIRLVCVALLKHLMFSLVWK